MSLPQEVFLAQELSKSFVEVEADGRPGYADIYIGDIDAEIECKATSPTQSSNSISLSTDYATLENKESLDYVYIISDETFEKFCVLHFEGLTPDDFHNPSTGSRGKSQMIKHLGMPKSNVLWGEVIDSEVQRQLILKQEFDDTFTDESDELFKNKTRIESLKKKLETQANQMTSKEKYAIKQKIKRAEDRPTIIENKFNNRRKRVRSLIATTKKSRFTYVLKSLPDELLVS